MKDQILNSRLSAFCQDVIATISFVAIIGQIILTMAIL